MKAECFETKYDHDADRLFVRLGQPFRWACETAAGSKYDLSVPGLVLSQAVATDGRIAVWREASREETELIARVRANRGPFPVDYIAAQMVKQAACMPKTVPDLSQVPPCPHCDGTGHRELITCHTCGEPTYTPGILYPCAECHGGGLDPEVAIEVLGVLLSVRYVKPLIDLGAAFRPSAEYPRSNSAHFETPWGLEGRLMPIDHMTYEHSRAGREARLRATMPGPGRDG